MMPTPSVPALPIRLAGVACLFAALAPLPGHAQLVGFALDPKVELVDGVQRTVPMPGPDMAVFLEFTGANARRVGEVHVPTAVQGPPVSIAVAADRSYALVSAYMRIDANDATKFVPNNVVSVVDLKSSPFKAMQTLELDEPPISVAIHPSGSLAVVVHRAANRLTLLSVSEGRATVAGTLDTGAGSNPSVAAFSPDGRSLLLTRDADHRVSLYRVQDGVIQTPAVRDLAAGLRPFILSFCGRTGFAVVSNFGGGTGDADTISLLDVGTTTPRVIDTVTVGPLPEGVACSNDGQYAAAAIQNMSNRPPSDPFYAPNSQVVLLKIADGRLQRLAQLPIGAWSQGLAFLDDGRTIFAQSVVDRSLHMFKAEDDTLKFAALPITFEEGAPVAFGVAGR